MGYHAVDWKNLPECCRRCVLAESDAPDEYSANYHYCTKGLFIPTKKGECNKQKLTRRNVEKES